MLLLFPHEPVLGSIRRYAIHGFAYRINTELLSEHLHGVHAAMCEYKARLQNTVLLIY
ncbi:MAG TPA: hypothetical protein GX719_09405 [Gammaproteobacteria bacterium]|nr:hypothetical protein [Gammaproteobacteria bacterium]